jgi:PAS domain S-box-containing protein
VTDSTQSSLAELLQEIEQLRTRLEEAEETLGAIRGGEVDALVVSTTAGEQIFTLRSADHPYRVLVETMNEGAATLLPDATILYCNKRFSAMLQSPPENVIGSSLLKYVDEYDVEAVKNLIQRGAEGPAGMEAVLLTEAGELLQTQLSVNSVPMDELQAVCLIATDLTAQKKNDEIVASEKLARSILEQAAEAIIVCDERGRIVRTNAAARSLCNNELLDREFASALLLSPPENAADRIFSIDRVLHGEHVQSLEASLRCGPGRDKDLLVSAGPLLNSQSKVIGAVITFADITLRKHAEEELLKRSQELARSNADLERFAFAASHDLQEPLRMVMTHTQLLSRTYRERVGEEAEQLVRFVESGVTRMRSLPKDLLSYSTIIHNPEKNHRHTDMNAAVFVATGNLYITIQESSAKVTHDPLPSILGDETQIAQVLQNLIGNAIKYHRKDIPSEIHISAEPGDGLHTFMIRDNGVGIAEQYRDTVFGLFKRLHGKEVPGSGIGLALCKRIIELHGGKIWVESIVGEGSTFYFTLPSSPGLEAESISL